MRCRILNGCRPQAHLVRHRRPRHHRSGRAVASTNRRRMMDHREKAVGLFRGGRNSIGQTARPGRTSVLILPGREVPENGIRSAMYWFHQSRSPFLGW